MDANKISSTPSTYLRRLMKEVISMDTDLDAFMLDYFKEVSSYPQFTNDYDSRLKQLLEKFLVKGGRINGEQLCRELRGAMPIDFRPPNRTMVYLDQWEPVECNNSRRASVRFHEALHQALHESAIIYFSGDLAKEPIHLATVPSLESFRDWLLLRKNSVAHNNLLKVASAVTIREPRGIFYLHGTFSGHSGFATQHSYRPLLITNWLTEHRTPDPVSAAEDAHVSTEDCEEYLNGNMSEERSAQFQAHVTDCTDCAALLRMEARIESALERALEHFEEPVSEAAAPESPVPSAEIS